MLLVFYVPYKDRDASLVGMRVVKGDLERIDRERYTIGLFYGTDVNLPCGWMVIVLAADEDAGDALS